MFSKNLEVRDESRDEQTWIYTLSGNLFGSSQGYDFQEAVRQKIGSGVKKIVIDLAAVERIDSCGVGILVATMWSASQAGAGLVLAALSPTVEKVLSIAMLLDHIDHADSVEDALTRLDWMQLEGPASS
jgi:anti-anti-sigma factor